MSAPATVRSADVESADLICANCGASAQGRYCPACGQKRIQEGDLSLGHAWHYVLHEGLHVDGRLFTTLKLLLLRPGQLTLDFVQGRRARHIGPVALFLTVGTLYFMFANNWMGEVLDLKQLLSYVHNPKARAYIEDRAAAAGMSFDAYLGYRNDRFLALYKPAHITAVLLGGLWLTVLFRRPLRYLAEHMVFVLHTGSFAFVLNLSLGWALGWRPVPLMFLAAGLAYFVLSARRVYGGSWLALVFKGLVIQALEIAVLALGLAAAFVRAAVF